jgi:heptosyltransferase II
MNILIIKLNATGDVVRTTPLLRRLEGEITWITARNNLCLIDTLADNVRSFSWESREIVRDRPYDLVINLEDDLECAAFIQSLEYRQLFGAHINGRGDLSYSADSRSWFDLSLISTYGKREADKLKLRNRRTYQEMIFDGLGFRFAGDTYLMPKATPTGLTGDVAIAPVAGAVWPMKNWAYYDRLKGALEAKGLAVNFLPKRNSLLEHLGDVQGHRCLVSGDSLPMHLALGSSVRCVSLFTCTSPWEIFDYGLQTKVVSPLLEEFFYSRGFDARATEAIGLEDVYEATIREYLATSADSGTVRLPTMAESVQS